VARQFGLPASTVRAVNLRYLRRWAEGRRRPALRLMGVDELYLGKKQKFLTVVTNLETGEPLDCHPLLYLELVSVSPFSRVGLFWGRSLKSLVAPRRSKGRFFRTFPTSPQFSGQLILGEVRHHSAAWRHI